ncbi:MAG TPA: metallophosphoesterase [Bryobacteraceae bacterium]|nr:metallophosphoesterase [Bryobacteraceae bacterium]
MNRRKTLLLGLFAGCVAALPAHSQDTFDKVQRVVAVGDVHGDYHQFVDVLQAAGVIDRKNKWVGGKTHLVQTGDVLDRGPDSRKVMDLLMELEIQAPKAGGAVHALIGNHEAMNIYGDLRYVSKEEYASYTNGNSEALRDAYVQYLLDDLSKKKTPPADPEAFRKQFNSEHPLGWVEHMQAFGPQGKYGKWLRQHNAILKINDAVFLHGGIGPKYAGKTIPEINDTIRAELNDFSKLQAGMAPDDEGPLWFRGLAQGAEAPLTAHVDQVLNNYGVRHIVIGHTPQVAVLPRFGGRVIVIDVGLSKVYGGPPAALIIDGGKYYALHRGKRLELPVEGGDLLPYLKAAAALDPPPSPIQSLIEGKPQPQFVEK